MASSRAERLVHQEITEALGKPCRNPGGEAGKCGFVGEQFISEHTNIIATAVSMNFSTDKAQSCLYVGDNANMTIYILKRSSLQELRRLGRIGANVGSVRIARGIRLAGGGYDGVGIPDCVRQGQEAGAALAADGDESGEP